MALLPVEVANYGPLGRMVRGAASPGSKVDQKAWVLFSSLTFAIVQYWQGFPLQGLSFHVDKVRVLD